MRKEIIILIIVTCILGFLKVSFNYENWTQPQLDTSCIDRSTPDLNRVDIEDVQLFNLYSRFFKSYGVECDLNIEAYTSESIDLEALVENVEVEEKKTAVVEEVEEKKTAVVEELQEALPPPPPPEQTTVIKIVDDDEIVNVDVELDDSESIEMSEEEEFDDDTPFMMVEKMPALGTCMSMRGDERHQCTQMEISRYVSRNIHYPSIAKDAGIQGTVFVEFVVGKDGYVRDVKILREVDVRLDQEAKRVVESLPKFEPGQQRGKNVSVQYFIPVKFIIPTEETSVEEVEEVEEVEKVEEVVEPVNKKNRRGNKKRKKKK